MKNLMIITSYYPPEIGAASNRIFHMAKGLKGDYNISIVTPLPNYPTGKIFEGYRGKLRLNTDEDGINIHRLWIYATNSKNKLQRLIAMLSYSFSLFWFFAFNRIPKTVVVQSPPLLVAFTCILFLGSKKRKLILNVSDLWPSAGLELGALRDGMSLKILKWIEHFNYKNASLILGQSEEILTHVKTICSEKDTFLYRNFPNFKPQIIKCGQQQKTSKITLVYAGLLGVAQGVLKLCKELDYSNIELHIYGSGSEEQSIKKFIAENPNLPLFFYGRLNRKELHTTLLNYDATIIPLLNRIYGSVPSKIFEYARLGLPIIYFGGGEGESIIEKYSLGWVVNVKDYKALNRLLKNFTYNDFDYAKRESIQNAALKHFNFNSQLNRLKERL